jgi:hypothetical protein
MDDSKPVQVATSSVAVRLATVTNQPTLSTLDSAQTPNPGADAVIRSTYQCFRFGSAVA